MVASQKALLEACNLENVTHSLLHEDKITVRVEIGSELYYFTHWHNPFNRADIQRILKDKDLCYSILDGETSIPAWSAYLDPRLERVYPAFSEVERFESNEKLFEDIEERFSYPLVVKPNSGSMGRDVRLVNHRSELEEAIGAIFNQNSPTYDYLALVQQYIQIQHEYRVLAYNGEVILAYEKDISNATFTGNLSPLHWDKARATIVEDSSLLTELERFIQPTTKPLAIRFAGYDIAIDKDGKWWLIEINGSPAFNHFIADNGDSRIVEMYREILKRVSAEHNT